MLTIEQKYQQWQDFIKEKHQNDTDCPFYNEYKNQQEIVSLSMSSSIDTMVAPGAGDIRRITSPFLLSEKTDFQIWTDAKKTFLAQMITEEPILLDFSVGIPRYNSLTKQGYYIRTDKRDKAFVNAITTGKDAGLPNFLGNSSQEYTAVIADFDILPEPFKTWEELRDNLSGWLKGRAIITGSRNNKVKAWFFVNGKMTEDEKRDFLKTELSSLWEKKGWKTNKAGETIQGYCIDRNGLSNSLLTWDMIDTLIAGIQSTLFFLPLTTICEHHKIPNEINKYSCFDKWNLFEGTLPDQFLYQSNRKQTILKILASSLYLSTDNSNGGGMALPTQALADYFEVSKSMVARDIRELVDDGFIVRQTRHFYSNNPSQRSLSARFVFGFAFMSWAKHLLENILLGKTETRKTLPEVLVSFSDNNWNESLWELSSLIPEPTAYLETVKQIKGWNDKTQRIKQAMNVIKCRQRYQQNKSINTLKKKMVS